VFFVKLFFKELSKYFYDQSLIKGQAALR